LHLVIQSNRQVSAEFRRPAPQQWQLLGLLTNNPNTSTPTNTFYFKDGIVNAGAQQRLLADTFRFTFYEACTDIPVVGVTWPAREQSNDRGVDRS
jgi:hypothetical protein